MVQLQCEYASQLSNVYCLPLHKCATYLLNSAAAAAAAVIAAAVVAPLS